MTDATDAPTPRRTLVAGDRAVLVELPDLAHTLGLMARLQELQSSAYAIPGIHELIPAARTLLVRFSPALITRDALVRRLDAVSASPVERGAGALVEVPVVYDGEDLDEVAAHLGLTRDEVIARHTGSEYTVGFAGFAPGFAYLVGGDDVLDVPRRASPRTRIPAGSVALAGRYSGVYPRASPGGWQLIGTTTLTMWDVERDPPAALRPGDRVRFVRVSGEASVAGASPGGADASAPAPSPATRALEVEAAGIQTLLQDAGRTGLGAQGVSESGALDLPAMRLANRLVGNDPGAAVLEIPYGGFRARARGRLVVAATGAEADVTVARAAGDIVAIDDQRPIALDDGDVLEIDAVSSGVRVMLAVRDGFAVAPVLGSRSRDTLAGLGPESVADGDVLAVREASVPSRAVGDPEPWRAHATEVLEVPIDLGPRDDWFGADALALLTAQEWTITPRADRVGLRLEGERPLRRAREGELPSEGAVTGSIQVPPSGQPMVFLADHPVTGGYPIVGVVRHDALPLLAQAPPGLRLRFRAAPAAGL